MLCIVYYLRWHRFFKYYPIFNIWKYHANRFLLFQHQNRFLIISIANFQMRNFLKVNLFDNNFLIIIYKNIIMNFTFCFSIFRKVMVFLTKSTWRICFAGLNFSLIIFTKYSVSLRLLEKLPNGWVSQEYLLTLDFRLFFSSFNSEFFIFFRLLRDLKFSWNSVFSSSFWKEITSGLTFLWYKIQ